MLLLHPLVMAGAGGRGGGYMSTASLSLAGMVKTQNKDQSECSRLASLYSGRANGL